MHCSTVASMPNPEASILKLALGICKDSRVIRGLYRNDVDLILGFSVGNEGTCGWGCLEN